MYTDTITVFNQQKVKKQITWYPTVIRGVELQITAGRNRSTTGLENADSAKVFIKYENSNEKMLVETSPEEIREYLKPKSWNAYTEKNQAFTFQEGIDFFIQGEYQEELDVSLPDGSGFDFFQKVRRTSNVPILFLTASDEEMNIIMGLELGGDD